MTTASPRTHASPLAYSRIIEFAYSLGLSRREAAVLVLAAGMGVHRKEAADRLGCRPGTVDTYWRRILRKSGLGSQLELLAELLSFALDAPSDLSNVDTSIVADPRLADELVDYRAAIGGQLSRREAIDGAKPVLDPAW